MAKALDGIRVIDWTIWQQGPVSTMMLADLGAEVIKLEDRVHGDPGRGVLAIFGNTATGDDQRNYYFEVNNRHKKSLTVDLKKPAGRDIVYRLVEKADVFVQNYRKGVAERLGLDYATLARINPRLIYGSATGYGPKGPDAGEPSFDYLGLARSGIMTAIGEPDMPPLVITSAIADQMGAIMLAYGVVTALFARERHGCGQEVDISHLGSMSFLQGLHLAFRLVFGKEFKRYFRKKALNPLWNHYCCGDGRWICLAMPQSDRYWADFCKALAIDELAADARFADMKARAKHCEELIAILDRVFGSHPRDEWMRVLRTGGDFIFTVVNGVGDLPDDPQMLANEYIADYDHPSWGPVQVVGCPVTFSATPADPRGAAPEFGAHTEEILTGLLGLSWDDVARLKDEEVV